MIKYDRLCNILNCRVEDIMEHFPDDNIFDPSAWMGLAFSRIPSYNERLFHF